MSLLNKTIAMASSITTNFEPLLTKVQAICLQDLRKAWENNYSNIPISKLEQFILNIDQPHSNQWHQFSIKEHSLHVAQHFEDWIYGNNKLLNKLIPFDIAEKIFGHLEAKIDNKSKTHLFTLGLVLHDIGKYTPIFYQNRKVSYLGHEKKSEQMINSENSSIHPLLLKNGYNTAQIKYIAKVAGLHYELGHLRQSQILSQQFDLRNTNYHKNEVLKHEIALLNNSTYSYEMGLSFLFDTLGKTKVPPPAALGFDENFKSLKISSDERERRLYQWLKDNNLDKRLIEVIKEFPINIGLAMNFLRFIANRDPI